MNNVIEVKKVSKSYTNFKLKDVDFCVPKGSIVGLVGQNGAGKTTLIKAILEIIHKDSGEIVFWDNVELELAKREIGVVLDDSFFPEILKVNDIRIIMKNIYDSWDDVLFSEYLQKFQLVNNQPLKELSKGMRKKLEIITALAHHPKLLILDEPTSGLDPVVRNEILDLFLEFIEDGEHSILFSSHITSDLENVADYIVFIHDGDLVFEEPVEVILSEYGIIRCGSEESVEIDSSNVICKRKEKYQISILVKNKEKVKKQNKKLVIDKATIEDIMLMYVKGDRK